MSPPTLLQRWFQGFDAYRPPDEPIRAAEYDVAELPDDTAAKAFVVRHHYSGSYPAADPRLIWIPSRPHAKSPTVPHLTERRNPMPQSNGKHPVTVVTACMRADGCPDFALTRVEVTAEEAENGIHYYLAEADLLEAGYEEPFVHFDADEAPAFLLPAVEQYLRPGTPDTAAQPAR